jgi:outer membrane protein
MKRVGIGFFLYLSMTLGLSLGMASALTLQDLQSWLPASSAWKQADFQYQNSVNSLSSANSARGLGANLGGDLGFSNDAAGTWSNQTKASANISANVLPWTASADKVSSAQLGLSQAALTLEDARNTLLLNTYSRLLALKNAQLEQNYALAQQKLLQLQLNAALGQAEQGNLSSDNLKSKQNALESGNYSLKASQNALELARLNFYLPLNQKISLEVIDWEIPALDNLLPLEQALKNAPNTRSEILKAQSSLEGASAAVSAAQRDRWFPNLNLSGQYSGLSGGTTANAGLNFKTGLASAGVSSGFQDSSAASSTSITLSASISLLDPNADSSIVNAQTQLEQAKISLELAKQSVELDLRQKYADLEQQKGQMQVAMSSLELSQSNLATTQTRLDAGLATLLDLESAKLNVLASQKALELAKGNVWLAEVKASN